MHGPYHQASPKREDLTRTDWGFVAPGLTCCFLEHANAAAALNLIRLHAWWNGYPLDRTCASHLARLELVLAS